jgi:acyl-CoA thioesterase
MATSGNTEAGAIVARMMAKDAFSQWLGIEVLKVAPGSSKLRMTVREEMCNGFGIAHGGIAYSLADSALAFAANACGRIAVSAKTSIAHLERIRPGDVIFAEATCVHAGHKLAHYQIEISGEKGNRLALFDGMVYLTSKTWEDL